MSEESGDTSKARPYIGIMFECCGVYARIYRNKAGTAYTGRCPKCFRSINLKIGDGGSDNRFFRAR